MRRVACAIGLALAWTGSAFGQTGLTNPVPVVRLNLPPKVPSETIQIMVVLYGPFGANGRILPREKDQTFFSISASVEEKPATGLKIAAWLPGCEYVTINIPLEGKSVVEDLRCHAVGTKRLHGRITNMPSVGDAPVEVHADLSTGWMCSFFELADCMTPIIRVATAEVRNGEFIIDLPDLARQANAGSGGFDLSLEQPSLKRTATLTPADAPRSSGMMVPLSFAPEMSLVAVEFRVDGEVQSAAP